MKFPSSNFVQNFYTPNFENIEGWGRGMLLFAVISYLDIC